MIRAVRRTALRLPATRPPLARLFWTLGQLRAGRPLNASDVARKFEVGVRTAYRDLDFLRDELGARFEWDHAQRSFRLTDAATPLPPVLLPRGEHIALFFAEKVLAQYRGTPYEADLAAAFRKIHALLPEEVVVFPDRVLSFLSLDLGPLPAADADVFRRVVDSLTRRHRLLIRYRSNSSGRTLDRVVEPYRIFNLKGDWYVAAFDQRRRQVRDFALHRIRKATPTEERYEIDARFDFKAYMAGALSIEKGERPVNVAVRFSPRQARWIRERRWHRTARIQDRLDGGCVLRMRIAPTSELMRWVAQFGADAEVLAPRGLRQRVADGLRQALASYQDGSLRPGLHRRKSASR